jgi:hypothetical protein
MEILALELTEAVEERAFLKSRWVGRKGLEAVKSIR